MERRGGTLGFCCLWVWPAAITGEIPLLATHTPGRQRLYRTNTEANGKHKRQAQTNAAAGEAAETWASHPGHVYNHMLRNIIKSVWAIVKDTFSLWLNYIDPRFMIKSHVDIWWPCHVIWLEILVLWDQKKSHYSLFNRGTCCCSRQQMNSAECKCQSRLCIVFLGFPVI